MAEETEAACRALQDLARHDDPAVAGWFAAAGVPRDPARPAEPGQLAGFLRLDAVQALARALEEGPPVADGARSGLVRAVEELLRVEFTAAERSAMGAGDTDGRREWRRAVSSAEFPLRRDEITRLEQEGRAEQVTPDMLERIRRLIGDLSAETAQLARTFVRNVAARNFRRAPEFADLTTGAQLDLAELADDPGERAHWAEEALASLCSVTAQRMPDGSTPRLWGGPAATTSEQGYHARRLVRISRDAIDGAGDAQRTWYTKVAVTAAQAASGGAPALLQEVTGFPLTPRESAALSLAALAGIRASADLGSGVGPPDELLRAAHAIGSSDDAVTGRGLAASELLNTTWSRVSRGSMDLVMRGQRYYMPSNDTAAVSSAMAGLYRDPSSWEHPEEAVAALAGASGYLIGGVWPEQVAAVAISQHVRLGDAESAVALADRLAQAAACSSGHPRLPDATGVALVDAVSSGSAYASGLLERAVDALAERDGARWMGGKRTAITDAWVRARALNALCSHALASRSSEPARAGNALRRVAEAAETDTQYQNHAVKAVGALAALAAGDPGRARRLAHSPVGTGLNPGQSLVPGYIRQAIAAGGAPSPASPFGPAPVPSPWQVAGRTLTDQLEALADPVTAGPGDLSPGHG